MAIDLDVHGNTKPLEAAVQAAVNRIRRTPIKITIDDKGATQPLGNMKRGADEFTKSMEAANARILAFGASMAIINGVADAFKGMVRNMVEVEKAMADINVVMGLSTQNLDKFGDGLFKVAKEAGAAFNVAAQAATEYARQGLSVEESLKRTKDALILTRLTGMDSAEAVKALTAAMNTYGSQIKDTTQLVSKFAAVDVKFAVSAEDFAQAISRAGQSALSAGVDIDEFVGIVTAAQQKTARGGAVIGNSLKTIFTRIGRTDTLNQLEDLGIAVRDIEGNVLGAKRILSDLANTFDTLTAAQKAQIAQTVGGVFQINILKAVLSDAAKQNGILAEASKISAAATDESIQKNEQLRNTMSAMATETGLAIKQVSAQIGEIMLAPGMEKILNTVKSFAEGIGGALGDGESAGGKFATGLLKGIGNVLTGPGLVMLTAVFFKLLGQAAKFTKESLTSLVGTTSEAQKQKAIQTSLVTLFGQNAALNKEMLRTDISRTEKEKIILGLLKAQVAEANALNVVSKQAASTLYRQGFGPNLTQGRRKAAGHIPNYADPERAQAARGGYAAGTIRSMSMPGEGPVIYNSAETVKNFAGFKQPAIMPPQSSKAGKNYQQAFGSIHGFDPYAAGGYIPNYAKTTVSKTSNIPKNLKSKELGTLNEDSSLILLTADSSADSKSQFFIGKDPRGDTKILNSAPLASKRTTGYYKVNVPYYSLDKNDKDKKNKSDLPAIQEGITRAAANKALDIAKEIVGGEKNLKPYNKEQIKKTFNQGAFKGAAGSTFESAIAASLKSHLFKDYNARTDTSAIDLPYDPRVFSYFGAPAGAGKMGAEVKADLANNLQQGAAKKFYQVLAGGRAAWEYKDKDYKDKTGGRAAYAGLERRGSGYFKKAYGHIPNFADPLSDAIGREKAAGVPVSQIRVGSHGALMNKSNPLGLGVTNTHDEPNGLRDVFGANGFVPNYVDPVRIGSSDFNSPFSSMMEDQVKRFNKIMARFTRQFEQGEINFKELQARTQRLGSKMNLHSNSIETLVSKQSTSIGAIDKLNAQRRKYQNMLSRANTSFNKTGAGKMLGSTGGQMGIMMGLPMAAGFVRGDDPTNQLRSAAGGLMEGAGTGAAMGMMFGPLGMAIGGAVGGLYGFINGLNESEEAIKKESSARAQYAGGLGQQLATQLQATVPGISTTIKDQKGLFEHAEKRISEFEGYSATRGSVRQKNEEGLKAIKGAQAALSSEILSSIFSSLPEDYKFEAQEIISKKEREQLGDDYQPVTKLYSKEEYQKELKGLDDSERTAYVKRFLSVQEDVANREEEKRKGVIKQLNMQKVMIQSQRAAADAQFDIKNKYMNIANSLETQEKMMGHLMTEEQKARLKHAQAINKSAETYKLAESTAEQSFTSGILQQIQSGGDKDVLQSELKKILKGDNITEQIAGMTPTELLDTLDKIKAASGETSSITRIINQLIDNQVALRDNTLNQAKQQQQLTNSQADADLKINSNLGKRIEALKLMNSQMAEYVRQAEHAAEITRIQQEIERTKFGAPGMGYGAGIYRTEAEKIAFERDLLSKRPSALASSQVQMAGKTISELQIENLSPKEFLDSKGKFDIESLKTSLERELNEQLQPGQSKIDLLKASTENRKGDIQEYIKKSDPRQFPSIPHEERMQNSDVAKNLMLKQKAELQELNELERLQTEQKEKNQQKINDTISALKDAEEKEGKITEQLKTQLDARAQLLKYKRGEALPGDDRSALSRGMSETAKSMREQVKYMDYELGERIPTAFADGLATAMTDAINGTKSIKEGLMDAAISFLGMIQQAMMQKMAYQMVGAMGFSRGGNVRNYSRGGGVPAMVSNGEYVMGRDAVAKYGGAFMHGMNAGGRIPGFAGGGSVEQDLLSRGKIRREGAPGGPAAQGSALAANFGGGRGFDSGRLYQRRAMSGAFYAQSGNVGLAEDTSAIQSILSEEERIRQEAEAKRQAKKAKRRQLLGMVASIGLMYGLGKMNLFGSKTAVGKGTVLNATADGGFPGVPGYGTVLRAPAAGYPAASMPDALSAFRGGQGNMSTPTRPGSVGAWFLDPTNRYMGGPIRKYASGGHIAGKSGIDQIPAMLSEGEYVIRASSARQIGRPMLDRINAGKFYDGGAVSEIAGSSETGSTGGNTNNINISINMERGSSNQKQQKESDSTGKNPADRSSDEQNNAALAERIKQQVVSVIVEEQRPGGLLSD